MKIAAQDEYGLRILIQISGADQSEGLSIQQLSELEGLSTAYVAKLTRKLRMAQLIDSRRGHKGGYILSRPAESIFVSEVMEALGGNLYDDSFCKSHSGVLKLCTNSMDCSIRSLWTIVQQSVNQILSNVSIADLTVTEKKTGTMLSTLLEQNLINIIDSKEAEEV